MNLNTKQKYIWLFLITLIGGFIRYWQLGNFPPSLNWDEVSHGYNAYSILKTGMDEWGVRFPFIFKAFGDYKLPVYIYLTTIPVWIFGLNAFAVRLVSALAGTLAIPGIYLLFKKLFPEPRTENFALITAFLLAISPWHFFISRPALEANLALTFIIFGFYFLLSFLRRQEPINNSTKYFDLLFSSILLGLSLHTYNTARVFVPLMLLATIFIFRKEIKNKFVIAKHEVLWQSRIISIFSLFFFTFSVSIVAFQIFSGEATARYGKLQILTENTIFQIGEMRSDSSLSPIIAKIVFNRPVYFAKTVASNYIKYFSPQFFWQSVGSQSQFAIPGQNMLTLPVTILAIIGLVYIFLNISKNSHQFILLWLLLSPVAASLTADPPQALRPNPMIPALIILATLAIFKLTELLKFNFLIPIFLITIAIYFANYTNFYFNTYATKYSESWQYGYQEAVEYIKNNRQSYQNVFVTKRLAEPHMFYAFFTKLDPVLMQPSDTNIRFKKSEWFWTDKVDNVYFINDWIIPTGLSGNFRLESGEIIPSVNSILVTSPDHIPSNAKIVKIINNLDGSPAFIITSIR
jgi:4-amino-4-deoxy-L-arabinose transferase-like glycosyltransferase